MTRGLVVDGLTVEYGLPTMTVRGADNISFHVEPGERLGIVGESGSGKSTMALALIRMISPPGRIVRGSVLLDDIDLTRLSPAEMRAARLKKVSYIPQGAMNSLNPVITIGAQMTDAMLDHGKARNMAEAKALVAQALTDVNLAESTMRSYQHQLSGGMKQRVCIAIGMMLDPRLIVADEPTSALDVVTQRRIMETLGRLQSKSQSCLILIGHDMGLMAQFVDRLAVMYAGRIVEIGSIEQIFREPRHPYTRMLISAVPTLGNRGRLVGLPGTAPSLARLPPGCSFAPRCPAAMAVCAQAAPPDLPVGGGRRVACYLEAERVVVS